MIAVQVIMDSSFFPKDLMKELLSVDKGSRQLDEKIASYVGYIARPSRRPGDEVWQAPNGAELLKLPEFSSRLHEAVQLALAVTSPCDFGFGWEQGRGSARIGDGKFVQASTETLALCCAILMHVAKDRIKQTQNDV